MSPSVGTHLEEYPEQNEEPPSLSSDPEVSGLPLVQDEAEETSAVTDHAINHTAAESATAIGPLVGIAKGGLNHRLVIYLYLSQHHLCQTRLGTLRSAPGCRKVSHT